MLRASQSAVYGGGGLSLDDVRSLAATEAQRLRDASGAEAYERRELLEDLASRLAVLVTGMAGPEYGPLRDLVTLLNGDAALETKWTTALNTLTAFAPNAGGTNAGGTGESESGAAGNAPTGNDSTGQGSGSGSATQARRSFWKRD
jgi:Ca-activated chloride channel family protein